MARPVRRRGRLGALLAATVLVSAQALPTLTAPVNDFAGVIDAASAAELARRIRALEAATKDVVVVVTVKSHAPYATIEEYAVKLFESAGIGTRRLDNALVVVLAQAERRDRNEVGYGLEEFVTDGFAGDVIRQQMLPAFREGRFGGGLLAGATRLINRIAERRGVGPVAVEATRDRAAPPVPAVLLFIVAIIVALVVALMRRKFRGPPRRRGPLGPWSGWTGGLGGFGGGILGGGFGGLGGGSSGGFGGFGGGRSGGGGASGGW